MEIQAYFEEWSCEPGDTVRMAISTAHASVRASLVLLISGPGQGGQIEGRVRDFSSVLNMTVAGRIQKTAVGAYTELPLPTAVVGRSVRAHCLVRATALQRDTTQTISSLGDIARVTASCRLGAWSQ